MCTDGLTGGYSCGARGEVVHVECAICVAAISEPRLIFTEAVGRRTKWQEVLPIIISSSAVRTNMIPLSKVVQLSTGVDTTSSRGLPPCTSYKPIIVECHTEAVDRSGGGCVQWVSTGLSCL